MSKFAGAALIFSSVLVGGQLGDAEGPDQSVLVMAAPGQLDAVTQRAIAIGAEIDAPLAIVNGFAAHMTSTDQQALLAAGGVASITPDRPVEAQGRPLANLPGTHYDPALEAGSMYQVNQLIGSSTYWRNGYYGSGVDVAVVDTGVASTPLLGNRLLAGVDTSGENSPLTDGNGHGTHIATIIAGSETTWDYENPDLYVGVAPQSRIVSVKVASSTGATSTTQVIQGLDWIAQNGRAGGRRIRVVNLSFGAPPLSDYRADPLSVAVERLWNSGYTVVASTGNAGQWSGLAAPAYNPHTIAVGSLDTNGTVDTDDDYVASYSSAGTNWRGRNVDLVAPGRSVQGVASAGSAAAREVNARINTQFVRGSGTSQAAAVVSGAAALVIQQRWSAGNGNPASVQYALRAHSRYLDDQDGRLQGGGVVNLTCVYDWWVSASFSTTLSRGGGSEGSGTWDGNRWAGNRWAGNRWAGQAWMTSWN